MSQHVPHSLFLIPAKGSLVSYCILIIMSGMLRPCWYGAEGGREVARFWKAGSLTSEKGSCTLTLLLDKARGEGGEGPGGERGEKVEAL